MMREVIAKRSGITNAIRKIFATGRTGNPRAQEKVAERIRKAGAVHVTLKPGKSLKYEMTILEISGWDPARNAEVLQDDPLPEKPWLVVYATIIKDKERNVFSHPVMFITHHALSRYAQRLDLRSSEQIVPLADTIWIKALSANTDAAGLPIKSIFEPPPKGYRIPINDSAIVVLCKHESRPALVATTILFIGDKT